LSITMYILGQYIAPNFPLGEGLQFFPK